MNLLTILINRWSSLLLQLHLNTGVTKYQLKNDTYTDSSTKIQTF